MARRAVYPKGAEAVQVRPARPRGGGERGVDQVDRPDRRDEALECRGRRTCRRDAVSAFAKEVLQRDRSGQTRLIGQARSSSRRENAGSDRLARQEGRRRRLSRSGEIGFT